MGRRQKAELLAYLERERPESRGAEIAQKLAETKGWLGVDDAWLRNGSILIHGLTSSSAKIRGEVGKILEEVRRFFCGEHERNGELLEAARFPFPVEPAVI